MCGTRFWATVVVAVIMVIGNGRDGRRLQGHKRAVPQLERHQHRNEQSQNNA
ncbi:MAG: hypothetical protein HZA61_09750 [Candidatus Eisenbacteria bacterium]|uniref:Uncharacterized protein n=1 Tax=Eiseniibacteriota bacterium TaxID=2212470 RepID=A0A933SCC7_UNCEI|nr:hypothetical protein [Candidatus Eisenbacteria bacterium]